MSRGPQALLRMAQLQYPRSWGDDRVGAVGTAGGSGGGLQVMMTVETEEEQNKKYLTRAVPGIVRPVWDQPSPVGVDRARVGARYDGEVLLRCNVEPRLIVERELRIEPLLDLRLWVEQGVAAAHTSVILGGAVFYNECRNTRPDQRRLL
jgi:hypothetical protein